MRIRYLGIVLVLLALVLPASPAHAGGVVTVCDEAHLLTALEGGGTVTFTCSGTIVLAATITIAVDTTIDGSGQDVAISGNNAVRVFIVELGVTLSLDSLTVAHGLATNDNGGGIYTSNGTVVVSNSTFLENSATGGGSTGNRGGAIYSASGTVIVSNSTFSGNSAPYGGGGIYSTNGGSILTVSSSTFSNNGGGGIKSGCGTNSVSNSTFAGNDGGSGGGISHSCGTLTVSNSTFSGNSATQHGGGLYHYDGTANVSNSTFSGNTAAGQGGGIEVFLNGTLNVINSTLSGNSASQGGGGIFNAGFATVTLKNTIVANSLAGGTCSGPIINGGGNLTYPSAGCPGINANPMLGPLQNNGGPTETMALGPGSAAIDAANDATCAAAPVNNYDQRGIVRPQAAHCDIGAVEEYCPSFVPPATVGVEDIVAIATRWGWTDATPGWDAAFDLNGDNVIDMVDIMFVTIAWGDTCS